MEIKNEEFLQFFEKMTIQDLKVLTADYLALFPNTPRPIQLLEKRELWATSTKVIEQNKDPQSRPASEL